MGMTIGQLAKRASVRVETVRYYERRGLIPEPARTPAGYRQYSDDAVRRIGFIRRAQDLGFSLAEIAELLDLRVRSRAACAAVQRATRQKLAMVDEKIEHLQQLRAALERLIEACEAREQTDDCPVLDAMEHSGGSG